MYKLILAAVFVCILCSGVVADTIELKNGRKLFGKIVKEDEKEVTLQLPNKGIITVKQKDVEKIEKNEIEGPKVPPPSESPLLPANPEADKKEKVEKEENQEGEKTPPASPEPQEEKLNPEIEKRINELVSQLGHRTSGWRSNARAELSRIGKAAVPALIKALESGGTSFHRWGAAQVLGNIGDKQSREVLVKQLRDPDRFVRKESAEALRKITSQSFGYDPFAESQNREESAKKWEEWWEKTKEEEKKKEEEESAKKPQQEEKKPDQ